MSVGRSELGRDARTAVNANLANTLRAGLLGGLAGGVIIWIYEAAARLWSSSVACRARRSAEPFARQEAFP